jgi:alpha-L-rhamnosidase
VRIAAPGAAQLDIRPPRLTMSANGVVATQRGPVTISWTRSAGGRFSLAVTIPANVTASVHIPAASVDQVRESGRALDGDPGVVSAHVAAGDAVVTIGSGHYEFTAG